MFKFNFITENDDKKDVIDNGKVSESTTELKPVNKYDECFEIVPTKEQEKIDYFAPNLVATFNCIIFQNDHRVYHIPIDDIIDKLAEGSDDISCAEQNHSDLIAGVYEGGAKVWECTETVGEYLTKTDCGKCLINEFREKICLDLGCGAGILGILALNNGASVHFQDYNKTVLQHITVPNVLANLKSIDRLKEKCRFYCGDWSNYIENTDRSEQFDYILTSETIYNIENYQKIINIIRTKMKSTGTCYLAAKRHYFGVGGSLRHFKQVLLKENIFNSECVFACDDNVGREVLRITFK